MVKNVLLKNHKKDNIKSKYVNWDLRYNYLKIQDRITLLL